MDFMKTVTDRHYDLAIADPPYGIGQNWKKDRHSKFYKHESQYKNDSIPSGNYFKELFRISKNQIVWGGNYYTEYLPPRNSWIVWDKDRNYETQHLSEGELAWTSFNVPVRFARFLWSGFCTCEKRHGAHPHEKPIALYKWILSNYAKPGQTIFDSHVGSGSIRIACYDLGFEFEGCEMDQNYCDAQEKRFAEHTAQMRFDFKEVK